MAVSDVNIIHPSLLLSIVKCLISQRSRRECDGGGGGGGGGGVSSKGGSVRRRDPLLEKMEENTLKQHCFFCHYAYSGISEQGDQRKRTWDRRIAIREKARSIYEPTIAEKKEPSGYPCPQGFIASLGGFHRFEQRFSLHKNCSAQKMGQEELHPQREVKEGYKDSRHLRTLTLLVCGGRLARGLQDKPHL
ncbi:hypothetical protein GWK47_002993 [Chionoecetes opilio]|uniref:Uncharacterized protein n=1 Tax=Chionoecetes opilio TaxID=41210 RepID=A0A8J8WL84_CHIOP|nr:hypothetical protein GWK47_002993 [Chionoecetes opilio]